MIAAVGSVLITPWNLYNNPEAIHYTLDTLGAFIGPLYGVLIADYYLVRKQKIVVDDLFTMSKTANYWYKGGYNPAAVVADDRGRGPGHGARAARGHRLRHGRRVAVQLVHRLRRGLGPLPRAGDARSMADDGAARRRRGHAASPTDRHGYGPDLQSWNVGAVRFPP